MCNSRTAGCIWQKPCFMSNCSREKGLITEERCSELGASSAPTGRGGKIRHPKGCQPETLQLGQAPGKGNKTAIVAKRGLGWKSGKPQQHTGVAIRVDQGGGVSKRHKADTIRAGSSQGRRQDNYMANNYLCHVHSKSCSQKPLYIFYSIYHY